MSKKDHTPVTRKHVIALCAITATLCAGSSASYAQTGQPQTVTQTLKTHTASTKTGNQPLANTSGKASIFIGSAAEYAQLEAAAQAEADAIAAQKAEAAAYAALTNRERLYKIALTQVGMYGDCTWFVEKALSTLYGTAIPDLGPTQFGQYGTVFTNPADVLPGDIMMRNGHVAIYAGEGQAAQGGFGWPGGISVISNYSGSPTEYSQFVRVN